MDGSAYGRPAPYPAPESGYPRCCSRSLVSAHYVGGAGEMEELGEAADLLGALVPSPDFAYQWYYD